MPLYPRRLRAMGVGSSAHRGFQDGRNRYQGRCLGPREALVFVLFGPRPPDGPGSAPRLLAPYAGLLSSTSAYVEKVRPQFLSLRQLSQSRVFSRRVRWQLSPVVLAISNSSSGLPTGKVALFFSEMPVSLRTSGLHPFGTVLKIRSFRGT